MSDPYFQQLFAERIGGVNYGKGTEIYKFEKIKRAKRKALAEHPERTLIDFGIGENDEMAPEPVRAAMAREINRPENRGYADNGITEYREAVARFMQRNFGVTLDPATEINHCIGSKTALAMLPAAFINPGDVTLMTVPGYPVAGTHTRYYGGDGLSIAAVGRERLSSRSGSHPGRRACRGPSCWSSTTRTARPARWPRAISTDARRRLCEEESGSSSMQDAAHMLLTYDGEPLSFLQSRGARGRRRRGALDVQGLSHDRLAAGLGLRARADRAGVRRRQGQQRLRPVHRDPEGRGGGARRREHPQASAAKVRAAAAEARRDADAVRIHLQDAGRDVFSLRGQSEGAGGRRRRFETAEAASQYLITSIRSSRCRGTTRARFCGSR